MDTILDWTGTSFLVDRPRIKTDRASTEGHVYILGYSDGMVKVGQSIQPADRVFEHAKQASHHGSRITRVWVSGPHLEWAQRERDLKRLCRKYGTTRAGHEYFAGVEVDNLIADARERMQGTRSTARGRSGPSVPEPSHADIMDAVRSRRLVLVTRSQWDEFRDVVEQSNEAVGLVRALLGSRPPGDLLDALRDAVARLEKDPLELLEWRYMHARALVPGGAPIDIDDMLSDSMNDITADLAEFRATQAA